MRAASTGSPTSTPRKATSILHREDRPPLQRQLGVGASSLTCLSGRRPLDRQPAAGRSACRTGPLSAPGLLAAWPPAHRPPTSATSAQFPRIPQHQPLQPDRFQRRFQHRAADAQRQLRFLGDERDLPVGQRRFAGQAVNGALPMQAALLTTSPFNPVSIYTGPVNFIQAMAQERQRQNQAVYLFDTIGSPQRGRSTAACATSATRAKTAPTPGPTHAGRCRLRHGDSRRHLRQFGGATPPIAPGWCLPAMNASLARRLRQPQDPVVVGGQRACTAATCNVDPETAVNHEIGGKWDALRRAGSP